MEYFIPAWPILIELAILLLLCIMSVCIFGKHSNSALPISLITPITWLMLAYYKADHTADLMLSRDLVRSGNIVLFVVLIVTIALPIIRYLRGVKSLWNSG